MRVLETIWGVLCTAVGERGLRRKKEEEYMTYFNTEKLHPYKVTLFLNNILNSNIELQHDSISRHYAVNVRRYLYEVFLGSKIGRRCPIHGRLGRLI